MIHNVVLNSKLLPPRPALNVLVRPRLAHLLAQSAEFPLTILHAGPGYGKSTTLTMLLKDNTPTAWLSLEREDASPLRFLTYLAHSFGRVSAEISQRTQVLLEQQTEINQTVVLDTLLNGVTAFSADLRLIIDDAQYLNTSSPTLKLLSRLIDHAPPNLTILLATRATLNLPQQNEYKLRGYLLIIEQQTLAFTCDEVQALFRDCYQRPQTRQQAQQLVTRTEGWPIVLPLIEQRLKQGATIDAAIDAQSAVGSNLFQFLTQQLLLELSAETRHFLRITSVLRYLDPAICDFVLGTTDSATILHQLRDNGLFVTLLDNTRLRYHHLFRDLLSHQLDATERAIAHQRAAQYLTEQGDIEAALDHYVAATATDEVANLLAQHGQSLISSGRLHSVADWISLLSPVQLTQHPTLLLQLGDIARLQSQFDSALGWYQQAQTIYQAQNNRLALGRALRGQARVYLDTVRPAKAEELLQAALHLSDGQADRASRARLLDLLAENLLNQGRVAQAEQYQQQARQLRDEGPSSAELPVRLMLRTGRLSEARAILEERANQERTDPIMRPRAHRETLLLLSLIAAMQGDHATASRCAQEGTERGRQFESPFVVSVGYMRQGAAWLLQKDAAGFAAAQRCFEQAITVSRQLDLPRLKVEAMWGMTQVHGFQGRLNAAVDTAEQGIHIARIDGDEWIATLLELTLGASYVLARKFAKGRTMLMRAARHAADCGDSHAVAVARLWSCLQWFAADDLIRLERDLDDLLTLVATHNYDFLFLKRTLLSPPDSRRLVPLLIYARDHAIQKPIAERLLSELGLAMVELHPGYQLRVTSFGRFRVLRGQDEIKWSRQSARELFQLLLNERRMLHREEIMRLLWPDATSDEATRHFKTAYAALCKELEPERKRNAPSAYIVRDGSHYGVRESADFTFDVTKFDSLILQADRQKSAALYHEALQLWQGEYLADAPYAEWAMQEQQRLHNRYLRSAERLAQLQQGSAEWHPLIETANLMLAVDSCWEPAYRYQMTAHAQLGNQAEVLRTYERCVGRLSAELNLTPSQITQQLRNDLLGARSA